MKNTKTLTRIKTLPIATEKYNFNKDAKKMLKKQLNFIYNFLSSQDNIVKYEIVIEQIDDIYYKLKNN